MAPPRLGFIRIIAEEKEITECLLKVEMRLNANAVPVSPEETHRAAGQLLGWLSSEFHNSAHAQARRAYNVFFPALLPTR